MPEDIRGQLDVIWTSPGYTPHAIAMHPRVKADVLQKIQKAFVTISTNEEVEYALSSLRMTDGFIEAKNSNWDDVKKLNLSDLVE